MLDGFGLHSLIWNLADQVVSGIFVASPMDARGRGIALEVRDAGVACDLTGATVYLVWTHRGIGKRGITELEAVDASAGKFSVNYPAAMCGAGGIVDASVMLSLGDGRYLSTRDFNIRVGRVLIDGLEPEDGFTLFVQAIAAYENADDVSTEATTAANAGTDAANAAAGNAAQAIANLQATAAAGDFDGEDGFVPTNTSGASVCKLGAGGVLTDPANDKRTWFWAHYYADGEGVLTATSVPESGRTLAASNCICAIGKYKALGFTPWDGVTGATHRQNLYRVAFAEDMSVFTYLNLNYLLYSCFNVMAVVGLGNLRGVRSMYFTFASCSSLTEIDFRGFDPSTLTDLSYCLSSCGKLTTICADASWALPTSGITGGQYFYGSKALVGGNGTAWSSSNVSYTYMRIDKAGQPGYLTAA